MILFVSKILLKFLRIKFEFFTVLWATYLELE